MRWVYWYYLYIFTKYIKGKSIFIWYDCGWIYYIKITRYLAKFLCRHCQKYRHLPQPKQPGPADHHKVVQAGSHLCPSQKLAHTAIDQGGYQVPGALLSLSSGMGAEKEDPGLIAVNAIALLELFLTKLMSSIPSMGLYLFISTTLENCCLSWNPNQISRNYDLSYWGLNLNSKTWMLKERFL